MGTLFYVKAFETGNVSLAGTIGAAFPVVTVPLSIILFAERLNSPQIISVVMIITGLILATLNLNELKKGKLVKALGSKSTHLAFGAMVIWGIYWTIIKYPIREIGWFWAGYSTGFYFLLIPLLGYIKKIPVDFLKSKKNLLIIILMSGLTAMGSFAFNLGLSFGYSSIVAPVSGASPVLLVILSRYFFRERLTRQQKMGIILTLAGIVSIGVSAV